MPLTANGATRLEPALLSLSTQAQAYLAPDKVDAILRRWFGRPRAFAADPAWDQAMDWAREVALSTPSLSGVTAFDRLARDIQVRSAYEQALAALLRRSRPRVLRVSTQRCDDLAAGHAITLVPARPRPAGVLFGRFVTLSDGAVIPAGALVTLDDDALELVRGFIRPTGAGRLGLDNGMRCMDVVYRHLVRHGAVSAEPEPGFDPMANLVDRLAAAWAGLGRDPTEAEQARARSLAAPGTLLDTLVSVSIAQNRGTAALAKAYRWIAAIMVETIALREANGSARMNLDSVATALNAGIARGDIPPETWTLFETLRAGVRRAQAPAGRGRETDLDKLVQRIQGLRAKTVEQGCTEQEALAAAEKVADLLDRYGLSLSELDLRQQACEGIGVDTGRKRRGPIDDCMTTIAAFFDCRVWAETGEDGTLRYVFFGLPADVQAAVYLHDIIALAFVSETATFQMGAIYRKTPSGGRRTATTSFQAGLAQGIIGKLNALRQTRQAAASTGAGRALVPVKESIIASEIDRLGLNLRQRGATRRYVLRDAYGAGQEAGERFEYRPGIKAGA